MLNQRPAQKRQVSKKNRPFRNRRPPGGKGAQERAPERGEKSERNDKRSERPAKPRPDYSHYERAKPRRYQVVFFDTFVAARAEGERIKSLCADCDQLNVVVRAEGDMDDAELLGLDPKVKVFAGAAWALIHERRIEDGWYEAPQS